VSLGTLCGDAGRLMHKRCSAARGVCELSRAERVGRSQASPALKKIPGWYGRSPYEGGEGCIIQGARCECVFIYEKGRKLRQLCFPFITTF